jgi:hypothetical protein
LRFVSVFFLIFVSLSALARDERHRCASATARLSDAPIAMGHRLLTEFDGAEMPWTHIESLDEQPIAYIGATPRELALGLPEKARPTIPKRLRKLGEKHAQEIREKLGLESLEFEMYPSYDGWGELTWAFARYRESPRHAWKWLEVGDWPETRPDAPGAPTRPVLPQRLDPKIKEDFTSLIAQTSADLYQRPCFGSCVWTTADGKGIVGSWLDPALASRYQSLVKEHNLMARMVPPPARFNRNPLTFAIKVTSHGVEWPEEIEWTKSRRPSRKPMEEPPVIEKFAEDFDEEYYKDLERFSGQKRIYSPLTRKRINFGKMGSGQKDNQLLDLAAWLERDYRRMGFGKKNHPNLQIERQTFTWQVGKKKIKQVNLIVKIKGRLPPGQNKPVVLADHYDKAMAEDIFDETGQRVTNPGANDNGTAMAALRRGAHEYAEMVKKGWQPEHDIWLVHFTGEEYPASSLGARHFYSEMLKQKQDLSAVIQMDMLGYRTKGDRKFQICAGDTEASRRLAQHALGVAATEAKRWKPLTPAAWSRTSYITETDAAYADLAGFPVILLNEHINLRRRLNPLYHQSKDLPQYVDIPLATAQSRLAIELGGRMAMRTAGLLD